MSVRARIYCAKNGWVSPGSSVSIDIDSNRILCAAFFDNFSSYPGGKMITTISTGNYGSYQTTSSNDEPEGSTRQQQNQVTITDFDQMSVGSSKTEAISFDAYMTDAAGNIVERDAFTTMATITRVQSYSGGTTTIGDLSCNMTMFKASLAKMVICHRSSDMLYEETGTVHGSVVAYNHNDNRYNNIIFAQDITSVSTSIYPFVKTTYNGMTCYISAYLTIGFISYRQALREQKICKIGEKLYRMTLMPLSFWNSLSEDVLKQLPAFSTWTWIENSFSNYVPCVTHGSGHYYINVDNGKNPASNSRQEQFLPVLVEIAAFQTGDILSVGNWVATDDYGNYGSYSAPVDISNALNYVNYRDINFDNTLLDNPLHWICYKETYTGRTYFICDRFAFSNISYSSAQQLCASFSPMTLYNRKFRLTMLSLDEYATISNMVCPDHGGYHFYNGSTYHIMTNTMEGSNMLAASTYSYTVNEVANEVDTIISRSSTTTYNQTATASNLYFVPALIEIELPKINVGSTNLGTITAWTNIFYSVTSPDDTVTIKEYLNGTLVNPVINNHDSNVTASLTFSLSETTFKNLANDTTHTLTIEATNSAGTTAATITFTKADGKIKLGYWDAISETGKSTQFYPTGSIQTIVGSAYSEIILNTSNTSGDLYTWIPFTHNGDEFYICNQFGINYISYYDVFNKIINTNSDIVINGYNYRLTLLKIDALSAIRDINYEFYSAIFAINNSIQDNKFARAMTSSAGTYGLSMNVDENYQYDLYYSEQLLYYLPILVKTESSNVKIVYSGSKNLGIISQPPVITYSTKGTTGNVQIQEFIDGKSVGNKIAAVGATNTLTVSESIWNNIDPDVQKYIEIRVTDANSNTDTLVIPFTKLHICNRINFHVGPLTTPKRCDYILAAANTDATDTGIMAVKFYACNNVYDDTPTWIEGVKDDSTSDPLIGFDFSTCTSKTSSQWGVAIKIVIESQDKMDNLILCGMNGVAIRLEDGSYF